MDLAERTKVTFKFEQRRAVCNGILGGLGVGHAACCGPARARSCRPSQELTRCH